jgi:hypothetical protein
VHLNVAGQALLAESCMRALRMVGVADLQPGSTSVP